MQISRRKAIQDDIPFLLELRRMTMNAHLSASGMSTSDDNHMKRILLDFDAAQVLEAEGRPVGILKVTRQGGEWELIQIQLIPMFQGKGIGAQLINELVAENLFTIFSLLEPRMPMKQTASWC